MVLTFVPQEVGLKSDPGAANLHTFSAVCEACLFHSDPWASSSGLWLGTDKPVLNQSFWMSPWREGLYVVLMKSVAFWEFIFSGTGEGLFVLTLDIKLYSQGHSDGFQVGSRQMKVDMLTVRFTGLGRGGYFLTKKQHISWTKTANPNWNHMLRSLYGALLQKCFHFCPQGAPWMQ